MEEIQSLMQGFAVAMTVCLPSVDKMIWYRYSGISMTITPSHVD